MEFLIHHTADINVHAGSLKGWEQEYDQIQPGLYDGWLADLRVGGIRLFRESANRAAVQSMRVPHEQRHIILPLVWPESAAGMRADRAYLLPVRSKFRTAVPADFDVLCVSFPIRLGRGLPRQHSDIASLAVDPCTLTAVKRQWAAAIEYFRNSGPLRSPAMGRAICRLIQDGVTILLADSENDPAANTHRSDSRRYIVDRCHELMCRQSDQPPTIMELCRALRISRRTLQYSFESQTGVPPVQYLRSIRLNTVRRNILRKPNVSLADLAALQGFFHPGYFSRAYARLFGELPSETRQNSCSRSYSFHSKRCVIDR